MTNGSTVLLALLVSGYGGLAIFSGRAVIRAELARRSARRTCDQRGDV